MRLPRTARSWARPTRPMPSPEPFARNSPNRSKRIRFTAPTAWRTRKTRSRSSSRNPKSSAKSAAQLNIGTWASNTGALQGPGDEADEQHHNHDTDDAANQQVREAGPHLLMGVEVRVFFGADRAAHCHFLVKRYRSFRHDGIL